MYIKTINNILNINNIKEKTKKYIKKKIYKFKSIKIFIINKNIYYTYKNLFKILNITKKKKNNINIFKINILKNQIIKKNIYIIIINNLKKKINYILYINIQKNIKFSFITHYISIKNNNIKYKNIIKIKKLSHIYYINLLVNNYLSIYKIYNYIYLNKKSKLDITNFYINIKKIKIYSKYHLNKKSNLTINNISIPKFKNKFIFKNKIIHKYKNSQSFYKHKCLINKQSKISINSLIKIKKQSKNSISYLINKNLYINKNFKLINKPKIQIFNKSSKCKHKTIMTNINKNIIFFLLNRGINIKNIIKIISISFIKHILKYIKNTNLKKILYNKIISKII